MRLFLIAAVVCAGMLGMLPATGLSALGAPAQTGVADEPCPRGAIDVSPGESVQDAVDRAGEGAAFCLKNGIHRTQVIRPKAGQSFHGEGRSILNGSQLLTTFSREGRFWVAEGQNHYGQKHGLCAPSAPTCALPEGFFIDDKPFVQVLSKDSVKSGQFFLNRENGRLFFVDDPGKHKVEATVAEFALQSAASNITIRNMIVEKYASAAQSGAIQARAANGWIVENCEVRLNSGAGIGVGEGSVVRGSNIHHNGQLGVGGVGRNIVIENNWIWANNTRGFDFTWEAGGVKLALSDGATLRANYVHDNIGPGLWCDIECHNALFEGNLVEGNYDAGIFYEISSGAVIRSNVVKHNGIGRRVWFWGADILVAASQDVEVSDNTLTVSPEGCGIVLIDQGRQRTDGRKYKTQNDAVRNNKMLFEGSPCAGGVSDTQPTNENYEIITKGANVFDGNAYRIPPTSGPPRFAWGRAIFDWDGFRDQGQEKNGRVIVEY
jgi:parallel beta-helix repeat protein